MVTEQHELLFMDEAKLRSRALRCIPHEKGRGNQFGGQHQLAFAFR